jgi:site-specific recombinase XerD
MLNNQDFAQSKTKSLGQSTLGQVLAFPRSKDQLNAQSNPYQEARKRILETIVKIEGAYAPATIRAYRSNFEFFINYCEEQNLDPLPCTPTTLAAYIFHLSNQNLKSASIRLAAVSVAAIHRFNRMNDPSKDPDVILELRRMFRKLGRHQSQAAAINKDALESLIGATDHTLRGYRDRALLLTAYDSLCRRSELAALRVEDLTNVQNGIGIQIRLRKSKADQDAHGQWISLSERTHLAIEDWLKESKINSGFLFRGITKYDTPTQEIAGAQINRIYKQLAAKADMNPSLVQHISGHSLRVGSAQDLLASGASMPMIMNRGRWSKVDTVMRYVENVQLCI